jgi:hypothetical protein
MVLKLLKKNSMMSFFGEKIPIRQRTRTVSLYNFRNYSCDRFIRWNFVDRACPVSNIQTSPVIKSQLCSVSH